MGLPSLTPRQFIGFCQRISLESDIQQGCWEWTGERKDTGYGRYAINLGDHTEHPAAHRLAFELFVGPIPAEAEIDHLCSNRGCVNPRHLEAVTSAENKVRMHQRRKVLQVVALGHRIRDLRRTRALLIKDLAAQAQCSAPHVTRIELGQVQPSSALLLRLAAVLEVEPAELLREPA